jgi:hypothetical protein
MTTTVPSTEIVVSVEQLFSEAERLALAGFLASYGLTRDTYALDLRMFTTWCQQHALHLHSRRIPRRRRTVSRTSPSPVRANACEAGDLVAPVNTRAPRR